VIPSPSRATRRRRSHTRRVFASATRSTSPARSAARPSGDLPADIAEQFRQLYRNIAAVLGEAEATWADVVEMTSYHVGLREHIETLFAVHREFVNEPYPAWTAVGVTELLNKDAVLEIAVTAVRRP
jgi:enamine deaminase RidA (YjgF/YER057c/UK114 family)